MKKIITSYILFCILFSFGSGYAFSTEEKDICSNSDIEKTYECRVQSICAGYASPKPVYQSEDYLEQQRQVNQTRSSSGAELEAGKQLYRENMGNIYKCAIVQSQKNSLKNLKKILQAEDGGKLSDTFGGQIEIRLNRLDLSANTIGCTLSDRESIQNKLNILKETTYEICKYTSYLDYLRKYYNEVDQTFSPDQQQEIYGNNLSSLSAKFTPEKISSDINRLENALAEERAHAFRVFPLAYQAYSEYENNFPIHFLLELIEADFLILRQKLYETLMPIAQLGVKMINAMSY